MKTLNAARGMKSASRTPYVLRRTLMTERRTQKATVYSLRAFDIKRCARGAVRGWPLALSLRRPGGAYA